jgi:phage head maturation protease
MTQEAKFKYTFPISKAEQRADGYYITGYASGPEIDSEGERMSPEAIARFANQINDNSVDRLVYRDAHAPDGVLRDLGEITKAWVESNFHLGIEVRLDDDNPSSMYLFRQLKKGKQYGMSVAGHVVDYAVEFVAEVGKSVLTYKNVVLDEISNTTRPAWYPSFGTVLSKSIKDASIDAPAGVTVDENELLDEAVEDAAKSEDATETTDEVVEKTGEADASESATEDTTEVADEAEKSDSDSDADVVKAGRKLSQATSMRLLELYNEMAETLSDLGVLEVPEVEIEDMSEKSASDAEEDTVEKTDATETTVEMVTKSELDALAAALAKATERIAELEARPATVVPGVITDATKAAAEAELVEAFAKASPSDKMRLAFAARTGGK